MPSHVQEVAFSILQEELEELTSEKVDTECGVVDMESQKVELPEEKATKEKGRGKDGGKPKTVIDNLLEAGSSDDGMEDDEVRLPYTTYNICACDGLRVCSGYILL